MHAVHQNDLKIPVRPIDLVNLSCAKLAHTIPPSDRKLERARTNLQTTDSRHFGSGRACRLDLGGAATGNWDLIQVFDDVLLSITDAQFDEAPRIVVQGEERLKLRVIGNGSLAWQDSVPYSSQTLAHTGPCTVLSWHPRGLDLWFQPGISERLTMLTVHCGRSFADRFFDRHLLCELLSDARGSGINRQFLPALTVSPRIQLLVNEVLWSPYAGERRFAFLQAKCIELMCVAAREFEERDRFGSGEVGLRLTRRDLDTLNRLRVDIESDLTITLGLPALARRYGMNERKLSRGFRELTGRTPRGYAHECRMQEAFRLLKEHNLSVSEAAFRVGYQHSANFSTAFRRHFGFSPHYVRGQMDPSMYAGTRRVWVNPGGSRKVRDR